MSDAATSQVTNPAPVSNQPLPTPGWKTTEFWLTAALLVAQTLMAIIGILPAKWAAPCMVMSAALYKILRTILKIQANPKEIVELVDGDLPAGAWTSPSLGNTGKAPVAVGAAAVAPSFDLPQNQNRTGTVADSTTPPQP